MRLSATGLVGLAGVLCLTLTLSADPPRDQAKKEKADPAADAAKRVPAAVARDRARLMHDIYASTLEAMHHHFFRRDRAVLPARAMEDIFADIDKQSKIKARWIAVNTPAMSVDHEPQTDFEKKAAAELSAGKGEYVRVEGGYYRRAAPIPLDAGCVSCHTRFTGATAKTPRFAGLVISIPVSEK
jgi:hypothetical protein